MLKLLDKNGMDITDECQVCNVPGCLGEPWCSAWGICIESKKEQRTQKEQKLLKGVFELNQLFLEASQRYKMSSHNH